MRSDRRTIAKALEGVDRERVQVHARGRGARVGRRSTDDRVVYSVEDTGIGIPPDAHAVGVRRVPAGGRSTDARVRRFGARPVAGATARPVGAGRCHARVVVRARARRSSWMFRSTIDVRASDGSAGVQLVLSTSTAMSTSHSRCRKPRPSSAPTKCWRGPRRFSPTVRRSTRRSSTRKARASRRSAARAARRSSSA